MNKLEKLIQTLENYKISIEIENEFNLIAMNL